MKLLLVVTLLFAERVKTGKSRPLQGAEPELPADIKELLRRTHDPETLQELLSDQQEVTEGDILLPRERNAVGRAWPILDLPYDVSPEIYNKMEDISAAIAMVSEHTCVTFHKRNLTEPDYLHFISAEGCGSYVGMIGGKQPVLIGPRCYVGNIAHEILHALGFHHEHTRPDRDQYISVIHDNIMEGRENNFGKHDGQTFNISYDFTSILHYGRAFFSSNGEPTIIPKTEVKEMGQRTRMEKSDIQRVRQLYHCDFQKT